MTDIDGLLKDLPKRRGRKTRPEYNQGVTMNTVDFSEALIALKEGKTVSRQGWNGKGMYLYLVPGSSFKVSRAPLLGIYEAGTTLTYRAHIDMRAADGACCVWTASQSDLLAGDWFVVKM